jgi:hypothetical protein
LVCAAAAPLNTQAAKAIDRHWLNFMGAPEIDIWDAASK